MQRLQVRHELKGYKIETSPEHFERDEIWSMIFVNDNHTLAFLMDGHIFLFQPTVYGECFKISHWGGAMHLGICARDVTPLTSRPHAWPRIPQLWPSSLGGTSFIVNALQSRQVAIPKVWWTRTERCAKSTYSHVPPSNTPCRGAISDGSVTWDIPTQLGPLTSRWYWETVLFISKLLSLHLRTKHCCLWATVIKEMFTQRNRHQKFYFYTPLMILNV